MKIAFLADSFLYDESTGVNGTQVQMYNLADAFARKGLDVHYVSFTRSRKRAGEDVDGITMHWIPYRKAPFDWVRDLVVSQRALDTIEPDVVYQRGRSHLTYAAARWVRRNGKKFVWASNGEDSAEFWKQTKRVRRSARPLWRKLLLYPYMFVPDILIHRGVHGCDVAINQTEHQRRRLQENFGKDGTVLPSYFPPPAPGRKSRKEKTVLWLANLSRNKQPKIFLDLAECAREIPGWTFMLGGGTADGGYGATLAQRAQGLGNVRMIGSVPFGETGDLFAKASLFVNTSIMEAEGLPNAFIQAWYHGTPVLSLNHDPNGWIEDRGLGFCAHGDVAAFLGQGKDLLADRDALRDMGENCEIFARDQFGGDDIVDAYLELFSGR